MTKNYKVKNEKNKNNNYINKFKQFYMPSGSKIYKKKYKSKKRNKFKKQYSSFLIDNKKDKKLFIK